jgi:hypothetical protein
MILGSAASHPLLGRTSSPQHDEQQAETAPLEPAAGSCRSCFVSIFDAASEIFVELRRNVE